MNSSCRKCGAVIQRGKRGLCDKHAAELEQAQQARRPNRPVSSAYHSAEYQRNRRVVIGTAISRIQMGDYPRCVICGGGIVAMGFLSCEHIIPLRAGGNHDLTNLGPAHKGCNYGWSKGSKRQ